MKARPKFKIVPHWAEEPRVVIPLHYRAPVARRAPEYSIEHILHLDQEPWRDWSPLR